LESGLGVQRDTIGLTVDDEHPREEPGVGIRDLQNANSPLVA
jgi:hypothetical protein